MRVIDIGSLTLEPQTAAHAEAMFVVLSDPAIYEYENEPPASLDWLRTRLAKLETRLSADGAERCHFPLASLPISDAIASLQSEVRESHPLRSQRHLYAESVSCHRTGARLHCYALAPCPYQCVKHSIFREQLMVGWPSSARFSWQVFCVCRVCVAFSIERSSAGNG